MQYKTFQANQVVISRQARKGGRKERQGKGREGKEGEFQASCKENR